MNQATQERPEITDLFMQQYGTLCWAQEQGDKFVRNLLDQGRINREEGQKVAERVSQHVRENQEQMQKWVQSAVQISMAGFRIPTNDKVEELTRKVDELTRKVEVLSKK